MGRPIPCHGHPTRRAFIFAKHLEGWPVLRIAKAADVTPRYVQSTLCHFTRRKTAGFVEYPEEFIAAAADRRVDPKLLLDLVLLRLTPRIIDILLTAPAYNTAPTPERTRPGPVEGVH